MITCQITSIDNSTSYNNLQSITLPANKGELEILTGHAEAFVLLKTGNIILEKQTGSKEEIKVDTDGGCYIKDNKVNIIL